MRHEIKGLIDEETTKDNEMVVGLDWMPSTIKVERTDDEETRLTISTDTKDKHVSGSVVVLNDAETEKLSTMLKDSIKDGEN
jgi:hypothetical protein